MAYSNEKIIEGYPGKNPITGVDWLGVLDCFDPKTIEQKYLNEFARRNSYETCYGWEEGIPRPPVEKRLKSMTAYAGFRRRDLEAAISRYEKECSEGADFTTAYRNCRNALSQAIGYKAAVEYIRQEYDRLGDEGRKKQAVYYAEWEKMRDEEHAREQAEYEELLESGLYYERYMVSVHEKVVKVRKGVRCSDGKTMTQRDFAKYLGYPINKYADAEKTDRYGRGEPESDVEYELLEKLVMVCHANPYWLFDDDCEADYAEYDQECSIVRAGDAPCVFAYPDVILRWIQTGKPVATSWENGVAYLGRGSVHV